MSETISPTSDFRKAGRTLGQKPKRPILGAAIKCLVGAGALFGVYKGLEYQYLNPSTQPRYFIDEVPNHTGTCAPYVYHPVGSKIYQLQPLQESLRHPRTFTQTINFVKRTIIADMRYMGGLLGGEKPATGFEVRNRCERHPHDRHKADPATLALGG